nr:hypothetical protein [Pseudoclavibacter sp. RFBG4]
MLDDLQKCRVELPEVEVRLTSICTGVLPERLDQSYPRYVIKRMVEEVRLVEICLDSAWRAEICVRDQDVAGVLTPHKVRFKPADVCGLSHHVCLFAAAEPSVGRGRADSRDTISLGDEVSGRRDEFDVDACSAKQTVWSSNVGLPDAGDELHRRCPSHKTRRCVRYPKAEPGHEELVIEGDAEPFMEGQYRDLSNGLGDER